MALVKAQTIQSTAESINPAELSGPRTQLNLMQHCSVEQLEVPA